LLHSVISERGPDTDSPSSTAFMSGRTSARRGSEPHSCGRSWNALLCWANTSWWPASMQRMPSLSFFTNV